MVDVVVNGDLVVVDGFRLGSLSSSSLWRKEKATCLKLVLALVKLIAISAS